MELAMAALGMAAGLAIGWLAAHLRSRTHQGELERKSAELETALRYERESGGALANTFKALSADALQQSNESFLQVGKQTLEGLAAPIQETLKQMNLKLQSTEEARREQFGALDQHLKTLLESERLLQQETATLSQALRRPQVRGSWGELALQRTVELAGLVRGQHFELQVSTSTEDGRLRPDLVVFLPGGTQIVVDAKAPMEAFLAALECDDDESRSACLKEHAAQVRAHVGRLSKKDYWDQFDSTPEFVVLFLPNEALYSAALQHDPSLIESAAQQRVIPATPTTLIALLRAVYYGWRQERIAENAQQISELGAELHKRIATMAEHFVGLGKSLDGSVKKFNEVLGSFESQVLVQARRFKDMGADSKKEIGEAEPIDRVARQLRPATLAASDDEP